MLFVCFFVVVFSCFLFFVFIVVIFVVVVVVVTSHLLIAKSNCPSAIHCVFFQLYELIAYKL